MLPSHSSHWLLLFALTGNPRTSLGISPNPVAVGAQLTISGTGFGATQGSGYVSMQNVHGTVVSWTDTQIVVTVPSSVVAGNLYVLQNGVASNTVPFSIVASHITGISPNPVAVGAQLTISGTGFGATQGSGYVSMQNVHGTVVSWADTQIVVTVPSSVVAGNLYVLQNGVASNTVPFSLVASHITGISPNPVAVGAQLTNSVVYYTAAMSGAQGATQNLYSPVYPPKTPTQKSAFEALLKAIGIGIGNITAHEVGHQFKLPDMDCDGVGPGCSSVPPEFLYEYYQTAPPWYLDIGKPLKWDNNDTNSLNQQLFKK